LPSLLESSYIQQGNPPKPRWILITSIYLYPHISGKCD
jgi:hypothetical protein